MATSLLSPSYKRETWQIIVHLKLQARDGLGTYVKYQKSKMLVSSLKTIISNKTRRLSTDNNVLITNSLIISKLALQVISKGTAHY